MIFILYQDQYAEILKYKSFYKIGLFCQDLFTEQNSGIGNEYYAIGEANNTHVGAIVDSCVVTGPRLPLQDARKTIILKSPHFFSSIIEKAPPGTEPRVVKVLFHKRKVAERIAKLTMKKRSADRDRMYCECIKLSIIEYLDDNY